MASDFLGTAQYASPAYILPHDPPDLKLYLATLRAKDEPQDPLETCSTSTDDSQSDPVEVMEEDPTPGPSGSAAPIDLDRVVLDVPEAEAEEAASGDDQFGLVETTLSQALRPVMRRCDEVLLQPDGVQVSAITSEQSRALGRVDGKDITQRPKIVKLDVEVHELKDKPMGDDPTCMISETQGSHRRQETEEVARGDDQFGLVETTLSQTLRPVMRRCDEVLLQPDGVHVSAITSEQSRALGRVDGKDITSRPNFVKLEVEVHVLKDEPMGDDPTCMTSETQGTHTTITDSDYGRPYKTTSLDRRSRGRGSPRVPTPMTVIWPSLDRGAARGRGRSPVLTLLRGRPPLTPSRGQPRPIPADSSRGGRGGRGGRSGRGGRGRSRGRGIQVPIQPVSGVVHLQASRPPAKHCGPVEVLPLPERDLRVAVTCDRLVLQRTDDDDDPLDLKPDLTRLSVNGDPQDPLSFDSLTTTDDPAAATPGLTMSVEIKDVVGGAATSSSSAQGIDKLSSGHCSYKWFGEDCERSHARRRQGFLDEYGRSDCDDSTSHGNNRRIIHHDINTGREGYRCDDSGKMFTRQGNLLRHQLVNSREKPCGDCGKMFYVNAKLVAHRRIHTGEKPYSCNDCGKKFTERSKLVRHRRIHTSEKRYSCDNCGKKFAERFKLVRHIRVHTGEKPYGCDDCGKKFAERSKLVRHRRIHTVKKPYSYDVCGKMFTVQSKLVRHRW